MRRLRVAQGYQPNRAQKWPNLDHAQAIGNLRYLMGHIDISGIEYFLSDGRKLLDQITFRVGDGAKTALVGPNGSGKTTLTRLITGELTQHSGKIAISGGLGIMRQFVGSLRDESNVRDLLLSVAPPKIREAAKKLKETEAAMDDSEKSQMNFSHVLTEWGDVGGYEIEVMWDICCTNALGQSFEEVEDRIVNTLSGGEQKKLVIQALLRGPDEVLLLDEPDNYLDVPSKEWLENAIRETPKTVLFITHDRELLNRTANRIVALELNASGNTAWVHGGGFSTWHEAREARHERMEELLLRWEQEHARLKELVRTLGIQAGSSPAMASKYHAMQTRLRKYEEAGPPVAPPREQNVKVQLKGGRTGERVVTCKRLQLEGLTDPFDFEIFFGDRVAILGKNGTGKSHFLRLLSGENVKHSGDFKLGARVEPGFFAQTHSHPEFEGKTILELLWENHSLQLGPAKSVLRRYELDECAEQKFTSLSGGQQARLQVLLLQLQGSTLLLLDEPTDNLDMASAEALENGLTDYVGTVITVTHDRWFTREFTRYLIFGEDGKVYESPKPVWSY